jgi:hypothetical protein
MLLARSLHLRLNEVMRGRAVLLLLGITALVAYSVGRQNVPVGTAQPVAIRASPADLAKPVALIAPATQLPAPSAPSGPLPVTKASLPDVAASAGAGKHSTPDSKRKAEAVLTAAAIAAIIVQASRDQYHASGRPCACPDDTARNGSSCGGRSAYSRPGGAAPLCYPSDVTVAMIDAYRQRLASR